MGGKGVGCRSFSRSTAPVRSQTARAHLHLPPYPSLLEERLEQFISPFPAPRVYVQGPRRGWLCCGGVGELRGGVCDHVNPPDDLRPSPHAPRHHTALLHTHRLDHTTSLPSD